MLEAWLVFFVVGPMKYLNLPFLISNLNLMSGPSFKAKSIWDGNIGKM
jgi:hypothetical protein